jgi:DNA-binding transcriptional LysR family regulator
VRRLVRDPDLVELRSFVAAADLGSIGRAAVRLQVSQPALSKRLQVLEALTGLRLFERSARGVALTPAGRRMYEQARIVLEQADLLTRLMEGLGTGPGPIVVAASHSATEVFVARAIAEHAEDGSPLELVTANAGVVRARVADGRAAVGVLAAELGAGPDPALNVTSLGPDEVGYGVPPGHAWSLRTRVAYDEFRRTPVVVRDPASNARVTVEGELRRRGLDAPPLLVQAPTPAAALQEAVRRNAPVLLSKRILRAASFVVLAVGDLQFLRTWQVVLPAVGEPAAEVNAFVAELRSVAGTV